MFLLRCDVRSLLNRKAEKRFFIFFNLFFVVSILSVWPKREPEVGPPTHTKGHSSLSSRSISKNMDSPLRVFISCGEIIQGSYFEVLFHQPMDGAVPKLATDRLWKIDGQTVRVSLTTDSGLAHYPTRLNDIYKQADVIVLVYSTVDRKAFEALPALFDHISGPVRDFVPATFVLLGLVPPGASDLPPVISPQELESLCSQFSSTKYEIDASTSRKELDDFWAFLVRTHQSNFKPTTVRSQAMLKEEVLVPLLTTLITKKEYNEELAKTIAGLSTKKTDKLLKSALKASGKRELFTVHPIRAETNNATLLVPVFCQITITNTTKGPLNWTIAEPDFLTAQYFFACAESSGSLSKGKSTTISICCVFYQPAEISRFVLIECPQEPGLATPIFLNLAAPLQPRDPFSTWTIDRKSISIGFRIASTFSANVYRSTLYGAVVAVKEWTLGSDGNPPDLFFAEWDAFVKLKHPNIAQFLGGNHEKGQAFMVLEYLKHGQLGNFLHNPPPRGVLRTIDLRLKMAADLAKAMAYLHSQKMLHRDLTSANVLVDSDCSVKLGDFGEPRPQLALATGTADITGSLDWTAPELLTTGANHTQKSDVFSYGVILWEFGAERIPARTLSDVRNGVLAGLPMEVKTRYPAFGELVAQCTHIDPESRPSFDEIVQRLEIIRSSGPASYVPAPVAKTATKPDPPRYIPQMLPPLGGVAKTSGVGSMDPLAGRAKATMPSSKVDSVILPELSFGPGQVPPPPPSSSNHTTPRSPTSPILPSSSSSSLSHATKDAIQNVVGSSRSAGALSPRSNPSTITLGGVLPSAVPLNSPGRNTAGSFVPPVALVPPPLGAPVASSQTPLLLRMPSMSKFSQGPPSLSPDGTSTAVFNSVSPRHPLSANSLSPSAATQPLLPVSPRDVAIPATMQPPIAVSIPSVPIPAIEPPSANAKLDNLIDWANDVYQEDTPPPPPAEFPETDTGLLLPPPSIVLTAITQTTTNHQQIGQVTATASGSGNGMTNPYFVDSPFDDV
jgi:serine/threonine protein kinase